MFLMSSADLDTVILTAYLTAFFMIVMSGVVIFTIERHYSYLSRFGSKIPNHGKRIWYNVISLLVILMGIALAIDTSTYH